MYIEIANAVGMAIASLTGPGFVSNPFEIRYNVLFFLSVFHFYSSGFSCVYIYLTKFRNAKL